MPPGRLTGARRRRRIARSGDKGGQAIYFDDFPVGYRFTTASRVLDRSAILAFAGQWDPQPFHLDEDAAKASPYGGLIASGFQTMLIAFVLTLETGLLAQASIGSPGIDEIRWYLPVFPGDALHARAEVESASASRSRPDRGFVVIRYDVHRADGERVMSYKITHMLRRAPGSATG